ncbi:MAG: RagB/SusD family nutrient uptake outer membrane protein [Ferruginibacter sp.]
MKNKFINKLIVAGSISLVFASCAKKLDTAPLNGTTPADTYTTAAGYKSVLAKIYGTLSLSGSSGPAGSPDIGGGLDEGSQISFIRMFFNCEELPTEEAIVAWNDETIHDFHDLKWTSTDKFIKGIYARLVYNITLINEYLRESTDAKLAEHGITGTDATDIKNSVGEARFLRAFNYWVMMDIFGKSTFLTEADGVGAFNPQEISRKDLFDYVESELKAIEAQLAPAHTAEYGRVDQGAAWALLARLYLNAEVYTKTETTPGVAHYEDALTYAKKVIAAGYSLRPSYPELFMADNDRQKAEFMFTINCDGLRTTSYGNTTFLVHAACGGDVDDYGLTAGNGWGGYRATKGLADKFPDLTGSTDKRALFTTSKFGTSPGQLAIADPSDFSQGLHVAKFRNIRADGGSVSDPTKYFSDIDFPVFRLPEMYFIYAECVLRGATGGDLTTALGYMNDIRNRANAGTINASDLNLNFILDERARELYWEGHRRTDLVRYGLLTSGSYLWPWKGGVLNGTGKEDKYNIFPVPAVNLTANPNLTQNTGY